MIRGSGTGEEPSGANVLCLIQIRVTAPSLEKIAPARQDNLQPRRRFQFDKRSQLFIRVHDEMLSVVAMRVRNPDRSPGGINR